MSEKDLITPTLPFTPFLLASIEKDGSKRHFVIDDCEGMDLGIDKDNEITQTFTLSAHKASEEEIEEFSREGDSEVKE